MKPLRDGKRRGAQADGTRKAFAPAHVLIRFRPLPARQPFCRVFAARQTAFQPFGTFRLRFQHLHERGKLRFQRLQCVGKALGGEQFFFGKTPALFVEQNAQIFRRMFQLAGRVDQFAAGSARHARLGAGVFCQIHQLRAGNTFAEKLAGNRPELMRLIKHHCLTIRQQLAHAAAAQGQIREKQMMVDHHHFGLPGALARLGNETFFQIRALLPQTVLARGNRRCPSGRIFAHRAALGLVAAFAGLHEARNVAQVGQHRRAIKARFVHVPRQPVRANIIGAPLEQRDGHRHAQRIAHGGQVAVENLVLQRFGAGGNDDAPAKEQRRHKVRKGFPRARAGFCHQHARFAQRLIDRVRHFQLLRARAEMFGRLGQRTVGGERRVDGMGFVLRFSHVVAAPYRCVRGALRRDIHASASR